MIQSQPNFSKSTVSGWRQQRFSWLFFWHIKLLRFVLFLRWSRGRMSRYGRCWREEKEKKNYQNLQRTWIQFIKQNIAFRRIKHKIITQPNRNPQLSVQLLILCYFPVISLISSWFITPHLYAQHVNIYQVNTQACKSYGCNNVARSAHWDLMRAIKCTWRM